MRWRYFGRAKHNVDALLEFNKYDNIEVLYDVSNMPELMSSCDIGVTSRGRTGYELAILGIPSISMAQNQREEKHGFAYMLGAEVIEKHFTLDKTLPGNDHYHAGDPEDFKKAISNFKWIDTVLGSEEKTVLECEAIPRREARRSLVLTRNMKAGETIKAEDLMPKRPGTGISPEYVEIVVGRKVVQDLEEDTILTWDMI